MFGASAVQRDQVKPPHRLLERLRELGGYTWDGSKHSFHSSYDIWHVHGTKHGGQSGKLSLTASPVSESIFRDDLNLPSRAQQDARSHDDRNIQGVTDVEVMARISVHALRDERVYNICKSLVSTIDPNGHHIVRPIDITKLAPEPEDNGPIVVCIFEYAGPNYLPRVLDYGPAWYYLEIRGERFHGLWKENFVAESMTLHTFLDFAIGAAECLEMLHGQQIVHGEIRGDAFHMDRDTGRVRLINIGAGLRTFEHSLTSSGWSTMSKELGATTKLSYMSPEQTGRISLEPDSRTDIFSLGVLLWTILMGRPAFEGETATDIIQAVLGQPLPLVSNARLDIPAVIGRIIQKASAKSVFDRYHSASGLRHDLVEVRRLLGTGNSAQLLDWQIGAKDVSPFFILPKLVVGRDAEHDTIVNIVESTYKVYQARQKQDKRNISQLFRLSEGRPLSAEDASFEDDNESSSDGKNNFIPLHDDASGEVTPHKANTKKLRSPPDSQRNSIDSSGNILQEWDARLSEKGLLAISESSHFLDERPSDLTRQKSSSESVDSHAFYRGYGSFRMRGRCEIITITGSAGLGKSRIIQSVQVEARQRGYFASSKFHQTERAPLGPLLKLLSGLFQQFFSESNMDPEFHKVLKRQVTPVWPMLHKVLKLPESLLSPKIPVRISSQSQKWSRRYNRSLGGEAGKRDVSPASSHSSLQPNAQSSQDFLRAGSSTKSLPLMNTFLEVLRLFTQHKVVCFCLDDLHLADEESLDLIAQIISTKIKMIIILAYRTEEISSATQRRLLDTFDKEDYSAQSDIRFTRITLKPLNENDVMEYVAATLRQPKTDVFSLGIVILSMTAGNPFYLKEMLLVCHRRRCIWYDYPKSIWMFDLDRIFSQFQTENHSDTLRDDFVISRLKELPADSRSILAWASLLGPSFSFQMILRLLNGNFTAEKLRVETAGINPMSHTEKDYVIGLQAAINANIIVPTEDDDVFQFSHDRYVEASTSLQTEDRDTMHFIVAQMLLKYYSDDEKYRSITASSISQSVNIIKSSVAVRKPFRKFLLDLAGKSSERGVTSAAVKLYAGCIELLQEDMWNDEANDVSYEETLQLLTEAAECYLYRGQYENARSLLLSLSSNAKTAVDKAPSWVLQSRIFAQEGNSSAAFEALKQCLMTLDIKVDDNPTFQTCDADFKRLCQEIQSSDFEAADQKPMIENSNLAAVGAVLVEATSAAFWSDTLTFYQMTLIMVDTYLSSGKFPQSGMGFLQLALIAVTRHNMISFASDCGNVALALLDECQDPFTIGRGGTIYPTFVGHLQRHLQESMGQLESALESAVQAGDRISSILNFGLVGNLKFFVSEDMVELESFCTYGCQDIPNWELDTPGGTMIITIRQVTRALQGKTSTENPLEVMSDEQHNSRQYKSWLISTVKNSDRPLMLYESIEIAPLFLYGHFESAIALGNSCLKKINAIWSARNNRFLMFFHALSLAGSVWIRVQEQLDPGYRAQSPQLSSDIHGRSFETGFQEEIEGLAMLMKYFKRRIEQWQAVTEVNYLAWSKILGAQIAEMENDQTNCLRQYEEALDHASKHGFILEAAIANSLLGDHLLRMGSRKLAKVVIREAVDLYQKLGASGVARYVEDRHQQLLQESRTKLMTADTGVQTDPDNELRYFQSHNVENYDSPILDPDIIKKVDVWQEGSALVNTNGLHLLDLTSILKSSQVISSVLQVDQLLKTMCEIILQNNKGVASLAAILIDEDPVGWVIAASGEGEGAEAHNPSPSLKGSSLIAEGVVNYCARFRQTIVLADLMLDNRFANVNESWLARNPGSKSVVALPICHGDEGKPLLGVLYLEGQPNAFSTRNLEVLQLLVNQIAISYFNALTLKEVERVSAINKSMVDVQKKALSEAMVAKAEALRSAKLAEEAAQAKTTFLANISHELRTPLNGVIGNSELLIDSQLEEKQADMADSIRVSADLLLSLINDILDFSKIEAHKMELHLIAFNANEMVREVIRTIPIDKRHQKTSKDIQIIKDIELPQSLVFGDPVRLHQILGNLVSNSLKFTEKGTVKIGAKTEWETDAAVHLTFSVQDTGIGVAPQQLHKLFKPFSQADASTARKYGGSGLGLSICRSLVESMGGTIKLESTENVGTTVSFSLTLPKADPEASIGDVQNEPKDIPEARATAGLMNLSEVPLDKLRICIAEDNPINQKIAIQYLERLKLNKVDAYDNGLDAVEGIRKRASEGRPYHVVLMDVQMPVLDGYESTKMLRKDPLEAVRGILVIALTASAVLGDREKCLIAGMNDYLAKPVRLAVLKKKLGQYMKVF